MRILIADDDAVFRTILARSLTLWGFQPEMAEDGLAAETIMRAPDHPRLALLDWEMPGLDGPELCNRFLIRAERLPTYCIILTVHTATADISRALQAGAHDFISKPMHHLMLRRRLSVWRRLIELEEAQGAAPLGLEGE